MKTKALALLLALLFMTALAYAATPVEKAAAISRADYPNASTVIIDDTTEIKLESNGDYTERSYSLVKVMTDDAKKGYGTVDFSYNSRYQEITSLKIRVHQPDGTVKEIPDSAITDGTSPELQAMNIFESSFRNRTAVIGDFPVGSAIEIDKTERTRRLLKDNFIGTYYFQSTSPILVSRVKITAPESMRLRYGTRNGKTGFSEKTANGLRTMEWIVKDSPQIIKEPYMPSPADVALSLTVSTFDTWRGASAYCHSLNKDKYKAGEGVKGKTAELISGLQKEEDKVLAIHRFISQKIRYMGSSMDVGAFIEAHEAEYTLSKGYGVCRDKAVLMTSMMREAGIDCRDALINPSLETNPDIPTIFFQHVVCLVSLKDGRTVVMDPTTELSAGLGTGYAGERYILPITEEGSDLVLMPKSPTSENAGRITCKSTLNPDLSLDMKTEIRSCGEYEMTMRQIKNAYKPEEFSLIFDQLASLVSPGTKVKSLEYGDPSDLSKPFEIKAGLRSEGYAVKAGKYLLLPLPSRRLPFDLLAASRIKKWGATQERNYDIDSYCPFECSTEEEMTIPKGYRVVSLPPETNLKGDVGVLLSVTERNGKIVFSGKISIATRLLKKAEYDKIKKAAAALKNFEKYMVILEKAK